MNIFHYIAIGLFAIFAIADYLFRARRFPSVRAWKMLGVASMLLYFAIATFSPFLWDGWLGNHQLFDASALPFALQLVTGFLVLELGVYLWHRTMHNSEPLWRAMHQMHHSAERVDIWGAFYFHPLDMVGWAFLGSLCLVGVVGLTPEATLIVSIMAVFCAMFQHANLKTPYWLGFIVTRPESHALHHERGVHAWNYGDIPLWDMLFGTFRNPPRWNGEAGFHEGSTHQWSMLLGRKVA